MEQRTSDRFIVKRFREIESLKSFVGAKETLETAEKILNIAVNEAPEGYRFMQMWGVYDGLYLVFEKVETFSNRLKLPF